MSLTVQCPACRIVSYVAEDHVGRRVRCKQCRKKFRVEATSILEPAPNGSPALAKTLADGSGANDSAVPQAPEVPQRLGRFQIRELLGAGAFGTVYRAYDPQLDREVALKVPQAGTLDSPKRVERFLREAKAAAQLRHPHIVPVYDAGSDGAHHYIASAFIEGQTLAAAIDEEKLDFRQAARIVHDLAEALDYAHGQGIVHRDVKPANVMLESAERGTWSAEWKAESQNHESSLRAPSSALQARLMDFGLAHRQELDKLTQDGTVLGTPAYMAPEQAAGTSGEALPASDQYSLGVVLYELLTGDTPFSGPPQIALFNAIHHEPPPPRSHNPRIPLDLETICLKALAKRPEDRYASCQALADDLRRWLEGEPIQARRLGALERVVRWCRKEPGLAITSALAAVCLIAVAVIASTAAIKLAASRESETAAKELAENNAKTAKDNEETTRHALVREEAETQKARDAKKLAEAETEKARQALKEKAEAVAGKLLAEEKQKAIEEENKRLAAEKLAAEQGLTARRYRYFLDIRLAQQALDNGDVERALELLEAHRPKEGEEDLRGLEWYSLFGSCPAVGTPSVEVANQKGIGRSVTLSPDGGMVAYGSTNRTITVWKLTRLRGFVWSPSGRKEITAYKGSVNSLKFSPDGKLLAFLTEDGQGGGTLYLWDVEDEKEIAAYRKYVGVFSCLEFAPDGKTLALGGGDGSLELWDVATRKKGATLGSKPHRSVHCLAFAPDGKTLASGGWMGSLMLWDTGTGKEVGLLGDPSFTFSSVAFSSDGKMLGALASFLDRGGVQLWDVATRQALGALRGDAAGAHKVAFSPDSLKLVTGHENGIVRVWDLANKTELALLKPIASLKPTKDIGHVDCLAFDRNCEIVAMGSITNGVMQVRDISLRPSGGTFERLTGKVESATFAPDVQSLVVGGLKTITLWDLVAGKQTAELEGHTTRVTAVVYSGDGKVLVSGDAYGLVKLWDLTTNEATVTHQWHNRRIVSIALSPNGKTLATVSEDGARLSDAATGRALATLPARGLAEFSPDSKLLAMSSKEESLKLRDVATGKERVVYNTHVTCLAFSPDSKTLACSPVSESRVKVLDATTGKDLLTLKGHPKLVTALTFTPDGKTLASGSSDGTVKLWDLATGLERITLKGHPDAVVALAFTPDGKSLVAAYKDGTLKRW